MKSMAIRQHLQDKALEKTILMNKFPHLIHGLASSCSTHFNETEEERKNTIESFLEYAIDIANAIRVIIAGDFSFSSSFAPTKKGLPP